MKFSFRKKDSQEVISILPCVAENRVWLSREDGEGGAFSEQEVENVIYEALDKYFRENH